MLLQGAKLSTCTMHFREAMLYKQCNTGPMPQLQAAHPAQGISGQFGNLLVRQVHQQPVGEHHIEAG